MKRYIRRLRRCCPRVGGYCSFDDPARFLSPAELDRVWRDMCREPDPEEREQIRFWNPQTAGEIIFYAWD